MSMTKGTNTKNFDVVVSFRFLMKFPACIKCILSTRVDIALTVSAKKGSKGKKKRDQHPK